MEPERTTGRTLALALFVCGLAAIASLAFSGRLGWYIHPRSIGFTVAMTALASVGFICAIGVRHATRADRSTGHATPDRASNCDSARGTRSATTAISWLLTVAGVVALLLLQPATLTAERAAERVLAPDQGSGIAPSGAAAEAAHIAGRADASLTLREWAVLARQPDANLLAGRAASVQGFVIAEAEAPGDVFLVARYVVTCCAVDAQPIGVPVYAPGWREQFSPGDWVDVSGVFAMNPDVNNRWAAVVMPSRLTEIEEPADPYVVE